MQENFSAHKASDSKFLVASVFIALDFFFLQSIALLIIFKDKFYVK
jgi:hypothetical protein